MSAGSAVSAQQAAQPAASATELPAIEVTAKQAKAKPAKKAPAKSAALPKAKAKAAAPPPAAAPPEGSGEQTVKEQTGTGPVDGYVAQKTTTGAKTDTPLRQIPQSISVVGKEQIRDQGAKNLQETLRYTAGVVADGYGLDNRTDWAFIRGTEATEFLDGLKRTFNYYVFSSRIEPYFMERIEVLRGPPSVLYGQAPVGGILNSISKRPQDVAAREVTVEYGSFDYKQIKTDLTGPLTADGKWSYRLIALAREAGTQVDYVPDDRLALSPSLTYRPTADTSITVLGHLQNDDSGSAQQFLPFTGTRFPTKNGFIPINRFVGEPGFDRYDTDTKSVSVFVEHKLNEALRVRHNSRFSDIYNVYDTYYPSHFIGEPDYVDDTQRTITRIKSAGDSSAQTFTTDTNAELQVITGPLRHKLLAGTDFAKFRAKSTFGDALSRTPFDVFNPRYGQPDDLYAYDPVTETYSIPIDALEVTKQPNQDITQTGIYLQDQIRLGNWIGVVGVRHDQLREETQFSPVANSQATTYRAGLMYEFPIGLTPYVSYAESFVPVIGRKEGGGTFEPQRGEMVEAGIKYQAPGSALVINSAVFDLKENNRLTFGLPFDTQTGSVAIKGFEFEATGNLTPQIKAIASYSYVDAQFTGGDQAGFRVESVPHHLASLWSIYSIDEGMLKGWSLGGGVRYIGSSLDGVDEVKTPPVGLVDAMVAYDTKDWRWSLNATNLEDKEYIATCLGNGRHDCWFGTRRTIMTGITYRF